MRQRAPHPMVPCPYCAQAAGNPCVKVYRGKPGRFIADAVHQVRRHAEQQHDADLHEISGGVVADLGAHRRRKAS